MNKDLARLLVLENNIANLLAPEFRVNGCHVDVEVGAGLDIGSRLVNVKLLEVLGNG